jgi:hypothetical protein
MTAPQPALSLAAENSPASFPSRCLFVPVWANDHHDPVWRVTLSSQKQLLSDEMHRLFGASAQDCQYKLLNTAFGDDLAYMPWGDDQVLVLLRCAPEPSNDERLYDSLCNRAASAVHLDLAYEALRQRVAGADLVVQYYEDRQLEQQMGI